MGLAPYGEYREEFERAFDELVSIEDGKYDVSVVTEDPTDLSVFEERFGERRIHPEPFTQRHKDFAYHLQRKTEEILVSLVKNLTDRTGNGNVALAAGIGMNCKANRTIHDLDCVDSLFIQPAANDSGVSLGAALEGYRLHTESRPNPGFGDIYLGSRYEGGEVEATLTNAKLDYERADDICREVATLLADGKLVGWFQGRMEFGARALGNRSILADPRTEESLNRVNKNVKNREPWRPFAPSLLEDAREEYLVNSDEAPYMILLDEVREEKQDEIEAVVHVDGTTRPQTVKKEANERYYRLIEAFADLTGVPVVLNTSFNVAGEPIVESPEQAISDFYQTGLDALAIGDYLVTKSATVDKPRSGRADATRR
jgi:carbamoyltransferase